MRMMIFGAGYSGKAIGALAAARGHQVAGTTRSLEKKETLAASGIDPFPFDGVSLSRELIEAMQSVTHLVQSIAPGEKGDPLLPLLGNEVRAHLPRLEWIGYLSTVGVYGDHAGGWVDERTSCRPVSQRSVERLQAEEAWHSLATASGVPLAILRLSGIYGPGRNPFVNLTRGNARRLVKKDQVFNRIRVEDIASAVLFLAEKRTAGTFNVTDNEPCPPQDVVAEAARLMGIEPPPVQDFETAELTP
ncbi:MAG TPA: SDR family oxidoreductase, partial [Rhizobium sp.]|nr:SDR family oxidoreductase [Rhizobium sp.]